MGETLVECSCAVRTSHHSNILLPRYFHLLLLGRFLKGAHTPALSLVLLRRRVVQLTTNLPLLRGIELLPRSILLALLRADPLMEVDPLDVELSVAD